MRAAHARTMAAYNQWMNQRLYAVCGELSDADRKKNLGAFFKSIHGTLNHLLLADKVWMGRFLAEPFQPQSLDQELYAEFAALEAARREVDERILQWANTLTDETLAGQLQYTSLVNPAPRIYDLWLAVTHFFNHQTHHRGQVSALLSQLGKDYGVTDLIMLPGLVQPAR